jgi:uncharacterized protein YqhQ
MSDTEARKRLQLGGQAVIEGVMMRSPTHIATAVRTPAGSIVVKREPFSSIVRRYRVLNVPIVRGAIAFVETFVIAIRAISYSASQATMEPAAPASEAGAGAEAGGGAGTNARAGTGGGAKSDSGISSWQMAVTIAAAFIIGFAVFFYLPLILTGLFGFRHGVAFNLVDGLFRLAFLVLYIFLITRWREMRRIFEYHGAEHKAIFAFEEEGEANAENVRRYATLHPRCSTSFLLLVVVVSVVVFMFLGKPETIGDRLVRFAFIPVIGGVAYELLKLSAKPAVRRYVAVLVWPGLFLQKLTTKEPSPDQIEVAIVALNACIGDKTLETEPPVH